MAGRVISRFPMLVIVSHFRPTVLKGTLMYMAPEILIKKVTFEVCIVHRSQENRYVGVWYGFIYFNQSCSYTSVWLDIDVDESTIGIDEVQELLVKKLRPTGSSKYSEMKSKNWSCIDTGSFRGLHQLQSVWKAVCRIYCDVETYCDVKKWLMNKLLTKQIT